MISSEIWEDEHFGVLTDKAKILFIACISSADDDGRLSGNPSNLKATAFRFEEVSTETVECLLKEISTKLKNFRVYRVNGCQYIQLDRWKEHQSIRGDRYQPSRIPPCQPNDNQMTTNGMHRLVEDSIGKDSIVNTGIKNPTPNVDNSKEVVDNFLGETSKIGRKSENELAEQIVKCFEVKFNKLLNRGQVKKMLRGDKPYKATGDLDKQGRFIIDQIDKMSEELRDPPGRLGHILTRPGKYIK
jgi:hypothetical protein